MRQSGRPVSFNREARRIAERLRTPGHPPEQLLEVLSFRRADGREVSLRELPIAGQLGDETVRAEEVVLSVPDGRSVRTLVNASPVHGEGGAVASVVVTFQDLAPLDEIERLRTEFLGLVSHELREPLAAIKGSAATLLGDAALDPAEAREFFRIIDGQAEHMRGLIGDLLDAGRIDTGTLTVAPEPSEVAELVERARSTFAGSGARHALVVDLPAGLPPAQADRRRIVQVLVNLLANAARHAPESSPIRVAAVRTGAELAVSVADEGRGVAPERLARLFDKHAGAGEGGASGGPRPGACHLQGAGGGARGPHPGRERGRRARHHRHLHAARRGRARPRAGPPPGARARGGARADARPRGRRRPADAALRARRAREGGLRPARDRRGRGPGAGHPRRAPAARAARPAAARHRRHRADARGP